MGMLSPKLRSVEGSGLMYWCQGCEETHLIYHNPGQWTWDGNVEQPTISPSVLVRGGHYADSFATSEGHCWCNFAERYPEEPPVKFKCGVCHTFIRAGMVEFLGDCTHQYAGQTLPLPDLPDYLRD